MAFLFTCENQHLSWGREDEEARLYSVGEACPECAERGTWLEVSDDYELLEVLGRGGMGIVFSARHRADGHPVALKVIIPGKPRIEAIDGRFLSEVGAMSRLRHPGIIRIEESGRAGFFPFMVLEFAGGGNLDDLVRSAPQSPVRAAGLLEQLARAVHYMHENGIIHRDLKPSNILLDAEGRPKVGDFGLARVADLGQSLTLSGMILGTPTFMAPEQARGETHAIGSAADVYALGGILYYMIAGSPPSQGQGVADILFKVIYELPVLLREREAGTPQDLETICMKCLQKDPRDRYPTALDLAEDLALFLAGEPIMASRSALSLSGPQLALWGAPAVRPGGRGDARQHTPTERLAAPLRTDMLGDYPRTRILRSGQPGGLDPSLGGETMGLKEITHFTLFDGIEPSRLRPLMMTGGWCTYAAGETLMEEGSRADGLFLLMDGSVLLTRRHEDREVEICTRGAGQIIGEMGLILPKAQRTATVRAESAVRAFYLPGNPVQLIATLADPATTLALLRNLTNIIRTRLHECMPESRQSHTGHGASALLASGSATDPQALLRLLEEKVSPDALEAFRRAGRIEVNGVLGGRDGDAAGLYLIHQGRLRIEGAAAPGMPMTIEGPCVLGNPAFETGASPWQGLRALTPVEFTHCSASGLARLEREAPQEAVNIVFSVLQWLILLVVEADSQPLPTVSAGESSADPAQAVTAQMHAGN